jgi:hypothetical protein
MCQDLLILIFRQWLIQFRGFRTALLTTLHGDQRAVESGVTARLYPLSEHNSYYANLICTRAHSILGCDKSPILLASKENRRWPTLS